MKKHFLLVLFLILLLPAFSQVVYEDINNTGIYEFLDELANLRMISLNSAIKPYPREYIAHKLADAAMADRSTDPGAFHLNARQRKELRFYLQDYQLEITNYELRITNEALSKETGAALASRYDYKLGFIFPKQKNMVVALNPPGYFYRDSLFTFSLRPVLGYRYMANENGTAYHRWWGGSMFGYIGKHAGFYASLRDNNESQPLAEPVYFSTEQGAVYKHNDNQSVDYAEMRGGLLASTSWGSLGIVYDRPEWGDNYHGSNILSGKAPPFPYIELHLNPAKWFDFNYMHGWLNSTVVDSARSYYDGDVYRVVYANKFIAANMFTFIPWRGLNLSFGNSIIYSDISVNPLYLIPFLFFNAVDATRTSYNDYAGSNSQLFFNVSSRQLRHLNLYLSFFVDEWKMSRLKTPDRFNFFSFKAGFRVDDFLLRNVGLGLEYTRTNPMTYDHYIATTTFVSNDYTMGHYLRANSQEIFFSASYRPLRGVLLTASYKIAQHGDDIPYRVNSGYEVDAVPFMKNKTWQNTGIGVAARYEFAVNGYFFLNYLYSENTGDVKYEPVFMHGRTNTMSVGVCLGL